MRLRDNFSRQKHRNKLCPFKRVTNYGSVWWWGAWKLQSETVPPQSCNQLWQSLQEQYQKVRLGLSTYLCFWFGCIHPNMKAINQIAISVKDKLLLVLYNIVDETMCTNISLAELVWSSHSKSKKLHHKSFKLRH